MDAIVVPDAQLQELGLGFDPQLCLVFCTSPRCIGQKDNSACLGKEMVLSHLKGKRHKRIIDVKVIETWDHIVASLPQLRTSQDMDSIELRLEGPNKAHYSEEKEGYICERCNGITTSVRARQSHQKKGTPCSGASFIKCRAQIAFNCIGKRNIVYKVLQNDNPGESVVASLLAQNDSQAKFLKEMLELATMTMEAEESSRLTVGTNPTSTPWIQFTQWQEFFQGDNLSEIVERHPTIKEAKSEYPILAEIVQRVCMDSINSLNGLCNDLRLMLKNLRGTAHTTSSTPVRIVQPDTAVRYSGYIVRMVVFIVKAISLDCEKEWHLNPEYIPIEFRHLWTKLNEKENGGPLVGTWKDDMMDLVKRGLFKLCIEPVPNGYKPSPIYASLAYQGIVKVGGSYTFTLPFFYTPTIAAFMYMIRVFIVHGVVETLYTEMQCAPNILALCTILRQKGKSELLNDRLFEAGSLYLHTDKANVFRSLTSLFNYGKSAADAPGLPVLSWSDNGEVLYFYGYTITMTQVRKMMMGILEECENYLVRFFLQDQDILEALTPKWLKKHHTGFTNTNSYTNSFASKETMTTIVKIAGETKRLELIGFSDQQRVNAALRMRPFREFTVTATKFLKLLMLLIYMLAGQPPRGPELCSIKFEGDSGDLPNIHNDGGRICTRTSYTKFQSITNKERMVLRYLPDRVARLLTAYLLFIRPHLNMMRTKENEPVLNSFLFCDPSKFGEIVVRFNTETLTGEIGKKTEQFLGVRLTTRSYRHLAPAIARKHLSAEHVSYLCVDPKLDDEDELDVIEEQAGHTAQTGRQIYAIDRSMGFSPEITARWWAACKAQHDFFFQEGHFSKEAILQRKRKLKDSTGEEEEGKGVRKRTQAIARQTDVNRSLEMTPAYKEICNDPRVLAALYKLTGGYSFKSPRQAQCMNAVLSNVRLLLVNLETGGGKTLLFLLPTQLAGAKVTVVIMPLLALIDDLATRLTIHGIPHLRFHEGLKNQYYSSIKDGMVILVSQDQTASKGFEKLVTKLQAEKRLDRIVIDEVHMTVTEQSYRPVLSAVSWTMRLAVQLLLISATIPPCIIPDLASALTFEAINLEVLRFPTVRPNLVYKVVENRTMYQQIEDIKSFARDLLHNDADRGIVFCPTTNKCVQYSESLQCYSYFSRGNDEEEKRNVLANWRNAIGREDISEPRIIVATKALGAGIDVPSVRFCVHIGAPSSVLDFIQESGRAGRDGKKAFSFIFNSPSAKPHLYRARNTADTSTPLDRKVREEMQAYLQCVDSLECFRTCLHRFVDGIEISCCSDPTYELCPNCDEKIKRSRTTQGEALFTGPTDREAILESYATSCDLSREARQNVAAMEQRFDDFIQTSLDRCPICVITGDDADKHSVLKCPNCEDEDTRFADSLIGKTRAKFQVLTEEEGENPSTCYNCLFPKPFCRNWGDDCQSTEGLAVWAFYALARMEHTKVQIKPGVNGEEGEWHSEEAIANMLVREHYFHGLRTTRLAVVVYEALVVASNKGD